MNNVPLISVVVPVYNSEKTIERCLDSIIQQTYRNLEIIIVDDGSCDSSSIICDKKAAADRRIRVIHQRNTGVAGARNAGLQIVRGELLTWVDSDDWIDTDFIDRLYSAQSLHDADMIVVPPEWNYNGKNSIMLSDDDIMKYHVMSRLGYVLWGTLTKTSRYSDLRFKDLAIGEDADLLISVRSRCNTLEMHNLCGYHHIIHDGSVAHTHDYNTKWGWIYGWHHQYDFIAYQYPQYFSLRWYARATGLSTIARQIREYENSNEKKTLKQYIRREILKSVLHMPWAELQRHEWKEVIAAVKVALLG